LEEKSLEPKKPPKISKNPMPTKTNPCRFEPKFAKEKSVKMKAKRRLDISNSPSNFGVIMEWNRTLSRTLDTSKEEPVLVSYVVEVASTKKLEPRSKQVLGAKVALEPTLDLVANDFVSLSLLNEPLLLDTIGNW